MAKFKRYEVKSRKKQGKSEGRATAHMENKYFKRQRNQEMEQLLADDMEDYLEDHYL
jgi:hypothetical protein